MSFSDLTAATILIPIATGIYKFKLASHVERLVLFFLVFGFLIDASMQLHYNNEIRMAIITGYSLVESLFFVFLLDSYSENNLFKKIVKPLYVIFFLLWILAFVVFKNIEFFFGAIRELYEMFYFMIISFLSGFLLLKMVEKEKSFQSTSFWFVLALFVYCFCTFFLAAFIRDELANKIWYVHDIFNIIAYLLFTKAFLMIKMKNQAN